MQVEAWLQRAAGSAPTVTALQTPEARVSYAELAQAARAGAAELAERGARRGERIAIALPPGIEFAQALHACFLLGAIAVPVDLRLSHREREQILAGARMLVERPLCTATSSSEASPSEAFPSEGSPPEGSSSERFLSGAPLSEAPRSERFPSEASLSESHAHAALSHDLDAVCAVIHTSGTTSTPRPVELTYGNFLWSALGSAVLLGVDPNERWLCALPLSHVGGLSILVRSAIYATTAHIHERFDTDRVLAALEEDRITLVSLVATTLTRLLDAGLREPPHLRCALTGGGPVPAALLARSRAAGVPVRETYGLTECCSQAATAPFACAVASWVDGSDVEQRESVGVSHRTGAGMAHDSGAGVSHGIGVGVAHDIGAGVSLFCTRTEIAADGEILLSGPTLARSAIAADGRLHTGDLGHVDDHGFLRVNGRKADTIVSGGENIAPSEVEAVLETFPGVLEAAVLGRDDPQWGEAVTAIVVLAPGASAEEDALREHCAARLAAFKVPKRMELVSTPLPRTRSGKLLRREL